jgi:hypothetical protein
MPLTGSPEWTRRRALLAPFAAIPFVRAQAGATQDAWSILRKSEAIYRTATAFDMSRASVSYDDAIRRKYRTWGRMAAFAPGCFYSESWSRVQLIHPKAKVHRTIICCDGRTVYHYRPAVNEYTEEVYRRQPGDPPRLSEGVILFQRAHAEHFERFCVIAGRPQREPRLRGLKTITVFDRKVTCLQIDTHSIEKSGGRRWSEKFWIDPDSFQIRYTLRGQFHLTGDRLYRMFRWTEDRFDWHVLGTQVPLETFHFVPPPGARLVERFTPLAPRLEMSP